MRVAVIGTGGIANNIHMHSLTEMPDVEVVAACDVNHYRVSDFSKKWNIPKTYESYLTLLNEEKIDAALILVWPDQLYRITRDFLDAKVHCFIEKPAGITLFQSRSLLKCSLKNNVLLQVGLNRRHIPLLTYVLEILKDAGPLNQIEGSFFKHDSASFYNGCADAFVCDTIHALDIVSWLANSEPKSAALIAAMYGEDPDVGVEGENAWNGIIRFKNGITGIIKANYQTGGRVHNLEIHCQNASAYINLGFGTEGCEADILFSGQKKSFSISSAGAGDVSKQHINGIEIAKSDKYHRYYGYYDILRNFFDAIKGEAELGSSIESAVKSMSLIEYLQANKI